MKIPLSFLVRTGGLLAPFFLFTSELGAAGETRIDFSHSDRAAMAEGTRALGEINSWTGSFAVSRVIPRGEHDRLILGGSWQRLDFSVPAGVAIPRKLDALALQIGYVGPLSPRWTLRAQIAPGLFTDFKDLGAEDASVPATLTLGYAVNPDLQWFAGVDVEPRSAHPVVGGVGVRWKMTEDWTLLFLLPEPRIEYSASPRVTLFAGGIGRRGTYRIAEDFGRRHGRPELDAQSVDYRELVAHVGARWKVSEDTTLAVAAGWMWDRRFEFTERRLLLNGDGAASVNVSLRGGF